MKNDFTQTGSCKYHNRHQQMLHLFCLWVVVSIYKPCNELLMSRVRAPSSWDGLQLPCDPWVIKCWKIDGGLLDMTVIRQLTFHLLDCLRELNFQNKTLRKRVHKRKDVCGPGAHSIDTHTQFRLQLCEMLGFPSLPETHVTPSTVLPFPWCLGDDRSPCAQMVWSDIVVMLPKLHVWFQPQGSNPNTHIHTHTLVIINRTLGPSWMFWARLTLRCLCRRPSWLRKARGSSFASSPPCDRWEEGSR